LGAIPQPSEARPAIGKLLEWLALLVALPLHYWPEAMTTLDIAQLDSITGGQDACSPAYAESVKKRYGENGMVLGSFAGAVTGGSVGGLPGAAIGQAVGTIGGAVGGTYLGARKAARDCASQTAASNAAL